MLFCISDPDLQQDPAFPYCYLTKWSLQELFADLTSCNTYINSFFVAHYSQIISVLVIHHFNIN